LLTSKLQDANIDALVKAVVARLMDLLFGELALVDKIVRPALETAGTWNADYFERVRIEERITAELTTSIKEALENGSRSALHNLATAGFRRVQQMMFGRIATFCCRSPDTAICRYDCSLPYGRFWCAGFVFPLCLPSHV
jgi:hypothetical protein